MPPLNVPFMHGIPTIIRQVSGVLIGCLLTATLCGQTATSPTLAATGVVKADGDSTRTILLLGEVPTIEDGRSRKPVDIDSLARPILGGRIVNRTSVDSSLTSVAQTLDAAAGEAAQVVILIAGAAESRDQIADQEQQDLVKTIVGALSGAGSHVYVVPSDLSLDTLVVANLRIATGFAGATYVEPGSELGGRPYEEALEEIEGLDKEAAVAPRLTPAPEPDTEPGMETTLPPIDEKTTGAMEVAPSPAQTPSVFTPPRRATTESLVSSGVGEDGTASPDSTPEPTPESGDRPRVVTKRGAEATETLHMRPMPPLKQFEPRKPVPRLDIDKKAPDLAR